MSGRIVPVILCGGSGTRLWPVSRSARPKQMQALIGEMTMLQATAQRVVDAASFAPPVVVTGRKLADAVEAQLRDVGIEPGSVIVEPSARNTAPAIALAALAAEADDLLLVMPSDHVIADAYGFRAAVARGAPLAADGWIVTFGMRPDRPETGYGYIRRGQPLGENLFRAERFVEKPDGETAVRYLAEGGYEWNGGIFLFQAGALIAELDRCAAGIADAARQALAAAERRGVQLHPDAGRFAAAESRSIDHAVMEHAQRVAVVPVEIGWSDVGSWQALWEASDRDGDGNAVVGDAIAIGASNCLIRSDGPLVAAIGVEGLAIVATRDAILIVPRDQSQRVQEAVAQLRARQDERL